MHWGQIKMMLILSFLLLDVYLFMQVWEKRNEADISVIEYHESSIEEQLLAESIKIPTFNATDFEETYITAQPKFFTEEELLEITNLEGQKQTVINEYFLVSLINKPVKVQLDNMEYVTNEVLHEIVPYANEYSFWNWNEQYNVLVYFQNKLNRPIYYNQNALILLFLNDDNEVVYYTQTMLDEVETLAENKELIQPINAIEILYNANQLKSDDVVNSVNIGFHTRVPSESGVQVFAPVWKVNVNNRDEYFINAIEGLAISTKEENFIKETIESTVEKLDNYKDENQIMEAIKLDLEYRLDDTHRGD